MMNNFLNISFIIFVAISVFCILWYMPRMRGWFGAVKPQKRVKNDKLNKIALVIPARNESKVIGELFDCIKNQTYARENYEVFVLVKDPKDKTIEMAKKNDYIVHVIESQTCKGDALDFSFKKIMADYKDEFDAFLIIDADCMLEADYLEEMNNALASDCQIIQSKKLVKNYLSANKKANSLSGSCNGLIWTMIDDLGNRYKSDHKITNMTIGTGIMLRSDLVKILGGWPYRKTLTEDMELMNDSAIKGYTTFYYSYAKMYVEEATNLKATNQRRTRWLQGVVDSKRIYDKEMREKNVSRSKRRDKYFVQALWPVFYYIGTSVIFGVMNIILCLSMFLAGNILWQKSFVFSLMAFAVIYISFFILTIFCLAVDGKHIKLPFYKKLLILFYHPIFYMGYIPIITKALLGIKSKEWVPIERIDFDGEIDFEEDKVKGLK